jgi:hypothetical protein
MHILPLHVLNPPFAPVHFRSRIVDDRHDTFEHHLSIPTQSGLPAPSAEGPRARRKNHLRIRKTLTSIAQKRHDFGALTCSKRSLQSCAEQNHPRENIGEIPKEKNRVHFDSDAQHIASL